MTVCPAESTRDNEIEGDSTSLTSLFHAYMTMIREHQLLLGGFCQTLSRLGHAIENSPLSDEERAAVAAGIGSHVDHARKIIATIDVALAREMPVPLSRRH